MNPNFATATKLELITIVFFDRDCPKRLKDEAGAELRKRKRKARNPNIKYVEKR